MTIRRRKKRRSKREGKRKRKRVEEKGLTATFKGHKYNNDK